MPTPSAQTKVDVSAVMVDGLIHPATHVSVLRIGFDIVSVFAVDDGLAGDVAGLAVCVTLSTARTFRPLLDNLHRDSGSVRALDIKNVGPLVAATKYRPLQPPIRGTALRALVIEEAACVILNFSCLDPDAVLTLRANPSAVRSVYSGTARVALAVERYIAWTLAVDRLVSEKPA